MCGALNNLVSSSSLAARDISYFNGIPKLVGIKTSHDNRWARPEAQVTMPINMGGSGRLQANASCHHHLIRLGKLEEFPGVGHECIKPLWVYGDVNAPFCGIKMP